MTSSGFSIALMAPPTGLAFSMRDASRTTSFVTSDIRLLRSNMALTSDCTTQRPSNFSRHVSNMASKSRAAPWEVSLEMMASARPNIIFANKVWRLNPSAGLCMRDE